MWLTTTTDNCAGDLYRTYPEYITNPRPTYSFSHYPSLGASVISNNTRGLYRCYAVNVNSGVVEADLMVALGDDRARMELALHIRGLYPDVNLDDYDFIVERVGSVRNAPGDSTSGVAEYS